VRILFGSTGGAGHFHPLVPFIDSAVRRGDEVLVVVPPALAATVEARGHPYRISGDPPAEELAAIWERVPRVSSEEAGVLVNREIFGRLGTAAMLPTIEAACDEWRPDLVLHEPAEYASAIAADRRGIPHAQVAISVASIEAYSLALAAPVLTPYGDGVVDRILASPYVTRFPASMDPDVYATTRRFVEATLPPGELLYDWWGGSREPLVYLTFGSITGGFAHASAVYRAALAAVADLPVRALLTAGRDLDIDGLGPVPGNVHVEAWVPQQDVLASASVVVCHGGSGTTFGTLSAGIPLVIVPMFADQPANARRVAATGAGLVVEPPPGPNDGMGLVGPEEIPRIRAAIEAVLSDGSFRDAARRIADEMDGAPTADEVLADLLAASR
jgi:UDP:flavonoid glycosyltransferase YjiC (YdhE family)